MKSVNERLIARDFSPASFVHRFVQIAARRPAKLMLPAGGQFELMAAIHWCWPQTAMTMKPWPLHLAPTAAVAPHQAHLYKPPPLSQMQQPKMTQGQTQVEANDPVALAQRVVKRKQKASGVSEGAYYACQALSRGPHTFGRMKSVNERLIARDFSPASFVHRFVQIAARRPARLVRHPSMMKMMMKTVKASTLVMGANPSSD
jgi:hypothetical protein